MKCYLFVCIFFIPILTYSQSKDYKNFSKSNSFKFLTDTYDISGNDTSRWNDPFGIPILNKVSDVIAYAVKNGYNLYKSDENNQVVFEYYGTKFVLLSKRISDDNFFPGYAVGRITKKLFFSGESIDDGQLVNSITEISLVEYSNVSINKIKNFYNNITKYLSEHISLYNNINSRTNEFENPFEYFQNNSPYTFAEKIQFSNIKKDINDGNDYESKWVLKTSQATERKRSNDGSYDNYHKLIIGFHGASWEFYDSLREISVSSQDAKKKTLDNLRFKIGDKNLKDVNIYDLKEMVLFFLEDCKRNNINVPDINTLEATFEPLDDGVLAIAYGIFDDDKIIIKVNPKEWSTASNEKRWYILYHELGHDILNLQHGEGGKMMFNYSDKEYTWDEFFQDKDYMFKSVQ